MYAKNIKYTDYDGNAREETHYFNISKAELVEMRYSVTGGLDKYLEKIIRENDEVKIMSYIKDLISKSYGIKSDDGKRFIKSPEISEAFMQTEAYSELIMEMLSSEENMANFINSILPKDVIEQVSNADVKALPGKAPVEVVTPTA